MVVAIKIEDPTVSMDSKFTYKFYHLKINGMVHDCLARQVGACRMSDENATTWDKNLITEKFERFITSRQFSHKLE